MRVWKKKTKVDLLLISIFGGLGFCFSVLRPLLSLQCDWLPIFPSFLSNQLSAKLLIGLVIRFTPTDLVITSDSSCVSTP